MFIALFTNTKGYLSVVVRMLGWGSNGCSFKSCSFSFRKDFTTINKHTAIRRCVFSLMWEGALGASSKRKKT